MRGKRARALRKQVYEPGAAFPGEVSYKEQGAGRNRRDRDGTLHAITGTIVLWQCRKAAYRILKKMYRRGKRG